MTHAGPAVAILDVDGTMHPRSIGLALLDDMSRRGVGRADRIAAVNAIVTRFKSGAIDFPEMVRGSTAAYAAALEGVSQAELVALAHETWRELRGELFAFVRPLVARLGAAGIIPYIVSSSPHEIVSLLAADLGVADCDGSRFEVLDGRYSGECLFMPGAQGGKLTLLRRFAAGHGAALARSLALGNGEGDLEVLAAVGKPLIFEPRATLISIAREHGWPLVNRDTLLDQLERALAP